MIQKLELIKVTSDRKLEFTGITRDISGALFERREACVYCDDIIDTPLSQNIGSRENYVVGVGQFCPSCYLDFFESSSRRKEREMHERYFKSLDDFRGVGNKSWD